MSTILTEFDLRKALSKSKGIASLFFELNPIILYLTSP